VEIRDKCSSFDTTKKKRQKKILCTRRQRRGKKPTNITNLKREAAKVRSITVERESGGGGRDLMKKKDNQGRGEKNT